MTRRGHNEGTIFERKNKDGDVISYQAQLSLPDGKRRTFSAKKKSEVRRKLEEAKIALAQGNLGTTKGQTVAAYLEGWLATISHSVRPRTYDAYALNVKRLVPHIGKSRLDMLTPSHVQACYTALQDGLKPRTVRQVHMTLHKALRDAVRLNRIPRNVTENVTLPRVPREEMQILTVSQVQTLFDTSHGDRFHALWVLLATTGLRIGEAMGLRWDDIDWENSTVRVARALQRQRRGVGLVFVEPKSARSRRVVELSAPCLAALQAHKDRQRLDKARTDHWTDQGLVFCTVHGDKMAPEHIKRFLDAALERADLPHIRVHDLRHTAASIMLHELLLPVKLVSESLGHSSEVITLTTYGHLMPGMQREAADRMGSLFGTTGDSGQTSR